MSEKEAGVSNRSEPSDPVSRTKVDPNRSYREDALVAEIERLRAEKAVISDRLAALSGLKDGWDSYGGRAPNAHVLQVARTMTSRTPAIVPSADGSVVLEWHEDGLDIELWLDPEMKREVIFVSDMVAKMSGAT